MSTDNHGSLQQDPIRLILDNANVAKGTFHEQNIRKLEMVQHRAAHMVFSDYRLRSSISPILQKLQWPTLQERRAQAKRYMMYRIVYNLVDIPASHLKPTISVRGHNMRHIVPYARTLAYQRSFFLDIIRIWNSLPQSVVNCPTLDSFNGELQSIRLRWTHTG